MKNEKNRGREKETEDRGGRHWKLEKSLYFQGKVKFGFLCEWGYRAQKQP